IDTPNGRVPFDVVLGDVGVDSGSPFEVLVSDLGEARISRQYEIMRVRLVDVESAKALFPDVAPYLVGSYDDHEVFHYEKQIGSLATLGEPYPNDKEKAGKTG